MATNILFALLFSQQSLLLSAGEVQTQKAIVLDYEYMIRPDSPPIGSTEAEKLYSFASQLLDSGNYEQAVTEFRRFLYYFPEHPLSSKATYALAWARFKEGRYDEAIALFRKAYLSISQEELKARALYMMAESDYRAEDFASAVEEYRMLLNLKGEGALAHRASFMVGWSYLKQGRWRDASEQFSSISQDSPYKAIAEGLARQSLKGLTLRHKSPLLAGALSAYFPGAGQLYVGRKHDALVAFLINQGFIVGAIASIYSGNLFLGATLLALEVGWYSGNIYSALNGANKYNRQVQRDFTAMLHSKYGLK